MFSTVGSATLPTAKGSHGSTAKRYAMQLPKGFSVRIFKGPTLSSFPYAAAAKFDIGYKPVAQPTNADTPQNHAWASQRMDNYPRAFSGFHEVVQPPHPPSNTLSSHLRNYDGSNMGVMPNYSIYPSVSKDTYVYERSLSSKSDIFSTSDYDASSTTATLSPSSLFSPALSTDSSATTKSPTPIERAPSRSSLHRSSTPSSLSHSSSYLSAPANTVNQTSMSGTSLNSAQDNLSSSYSTALSVCRVPSSRGSSPHTIVEESRVQDTAPQMRPKTPVQPFASSDGLRHSIVDTLPPNVSTPSSTDWSSWRDALDESLLDAVSEVARVNASYNALPSNYYLMPNPTSINRNDHHSMAPIPLPPERDGPYLSDISSDPTEDYEALVIEDIRGASRQSSPNQHGYVYNPNVAASSGQGGTNPVIATYQQNPDQTDRSSPQFDLFIPPLAYVDPGPAAGPSLASAAKVQFGQQQDQGSLVQPRNPSNPSQHPNLSHWSSGSSSRSGSSNSDSGASLPPPVPVETRPRRNIGQYPNTDSPTDSTSMQQYRETPNQVPFLSNSQMRTMINRTLESVPVPSTADRNFARQEVQLSAFIPPVINSETATPVAAPAATRVSESIVSVSPTSGTSDYVRSRKDSIVVEATRIRRRKEQSPSISPRFEEHQVQRHSVVLEPTHDQMGRYQSAQYYQPSNQTSSTNIPSSLHQTVFQGTAPFTSSPEQLPARPTTVQDISPSMPRTSNSQERATNVNANQPPAPVPMLLPASQPPVVNAAQRPSLPFISRQGISQPQRTNTPSTLQRPHSSASRPIAPSNPPAQFSQTQPSVPKVAQTQANSATPAISRGDVQPPAQTLLSQPSGTNTRFLTAVPTIADNQARRPLPEPQRRSSDGDVPTHYESSSRRGPPPSSQSDQMTVATIGNSTNSQLMYEPIRRHSDGDQVPHGKNNSLCRLRVRWHERLICPSPIFPHQRRKGWFNRRGDQLWTNDGAYKPPPAGQEYPIDLEGYPEHGEGWMNEEGIRIDMEHRLIPKPPLRSALKQPKK